MVINQCGIDWEAETINIVRQKRAEPLAVAMRAVVGSRDRLKHIIEKQGSCV